MLDAAFSNKRNHTSQDFCLNYKNTSKISKEEQLDPKLNAPWANLRNKISADIYSKSTHINKLNAYKKARERQTYSQGTRN